MKNIKKGFALLLTLSLVLIFSTDAFAEETPEPVEPLIMDEETMTSIAEELVDSLLLHQKYIKLYTGDPNIISLGEQAVESLNEPCTEVHVYTVAPSIIENMISASTPEDMKIDIDEIMQIFGNAVGNALITGAVAPLGSENLVLCSLLSAGSSYVAELEQETIIIFEYSGDYSLAADFYSTGEHVVGITEYIIPTSVIPQIESMIEMAEAGNFEELD